MENLEELDVSVCKHHLSDGFNFLEPIGLKRIYGPHSYTKLFVNFLKIVLPKGVKNNIIFYE